MNKGVLGSFGELGQPSQSLEADAPKTITQLADIRTKILRRNLKHKSRLHREIAEACRIGVRLSKDRTLWKALVDADWKTQTRPPRKQQRDAVRHVLRFVFGGSPDGRKNASLYYRAVSVLLKDGIKSAAIFHELNKPGGLRALAARGAQLRKDQKYAEAGKVNGVTYGFSPKKVKNAWKMTMSIDFDLEPTRLIGLSGEDFPFFTLRGKIVDLVNPNRMNVIGFSLRFDGEDNGEGR
ncbi:hypothetical protein U8Q05_03685 [Rhizobium ruizarguesonis]|nr:hypothetical protein U8Q05_03685 [Rhizobium ruizarguesonis]